MDTPIPQDGLPIPQDGTPLEPAPRPVLLRRDPLKKISDDDWPVIRHLVESGVRYQEVANRFGVKVSTISTRASKERWLTPQRLALAKNGNTKADDPANAVVDVWRQRGAECRDLIYQGARKSLERFFALSPTPQSFSEAATAQKLLQNAIDPSNSLNDTPKVSLNILASKDFQPSPVIDV